MTRRYRKRHELPTPKLGPHAEINRLKTKVTTRIDRTLLEAMQQAAAAEGVSQTVWLESIIRSRLRRRHPN